MKKFKFFVLFGFVLLLALVSCDGKNNNSTNEPVEDSTYYSVIFDTQGGSSIDSQSVKEGNNVKRPDNPVKKGYQFNYWLNDDKIYFFSSGLSSDIVLVADWTPLEYQLSLTSNLEEASTLIGTGKYYVDSEVTIESKTDPGYIFVGWYQGNTLISDKEKYTFNMWSEDLTYEARYIKSTNVQYKVKHYKISLAYETELVETEVFYGTTGTILNSSDYVKEYDNYHWFDTTSVYLLNGNGTTVIEIYYILDSYNVKLNTNNSQYGVTKLNGSTYKSATIEYGTNNTIEAVPNPGYTFIGWYDDNGLVSEDSKYTFTMPANNLIYEARFAPSTNTLYKVEHYLQNIDNTSYPTTPYEVDELYGTTNASTEATAKTYDGFTAQSVTQQTINPNGTTVVKVYYTRNSYTITLNRNNTSAGTVTGAGWYKYGKTITIKATANPGYTFVGWYDENGLVSEDAEYTFTMPSNNLTYEARFTANTDTPYKVEHYLQNIDNTSYPSTPYEVDNLYGTTNVDTEASAKIYDGFTSPSVTQKTISGNGSTIIKLYYTRNSYTITLNRNNTSAGAVTGAGTYKYCKSITIKATANPGYTFVGWYDENGLVCEDSEYSFEITVNNLTFEARFTPNTNTPYRVEHYLQNVDNTSYPATPYEVDELYGTTNANTEATAKTYDGFTSPSVTQKTISGNGSTIVRLYYTRNSYTVTKKIYFNDKCTSSETTSVSYMASTIIDFNALLGCELESLYINDNKIENEIDSVLYITQNVLIELIYISNEEMSNFIFTSGKNKCIITGIIDKSVKEIVVPNYVQKINYGAFNGCSNLEKISIPYVGDENTGYYDDSYVSGFGYIFGNESFENSYSIVQHDALYHGYGNENSNPSVEDSHYYIPNNLVEVNITNAEILASNAFMNCTSISKIGIPCSIKYIGNAFNNNVKYDLFYNGDINEWISIEFIYTGIGTSLPFHYDLYLIDSKGSIDFYDESYELLTFANLYEGISTINNAFLNNKNINSIVIPSTITRIRASFAGCISLNKIYYGGTNTDSWNSIQWPYAPYKETINDMAIYYYSETIPKVNGNYWHYVDGVVTEW